MRVSGPRDAAAGAAAEAKTTATHFGEMAAKSSKRAALLYTRAPWVGREGHRRDAVAAAALQ